MKIAVITTSRADYGIYLPLVKALHDHPDFDLNLIVSGTHVSPRFGHTVDDIKSAGYNYFTTSDVIGEGELTPVKINSIYSKVFEEVSNHLSKQKYDWIISLGDRYEMHAAVSAAVVYGYPIVHLHGGEITRGAYDEKFRHSITKLSDLHFVSCEQHRTRVLQMGAHENSVYNTGALTLENLKNVELLNIEQLSNDIGVDFSKPVFLVTINPETNAKDNGLNLLRQTLEAFEKRDEFILVTLGNADTCGDVFISELKKWCDLNKHRAKAVASLGVKRYFSAMRHSVIMVGNSSSGIIEAASFGLPVVNIGDRQAGRERSDNIFDSTVEKEKILKAIESACSFSKEDVENIYFKEGATEIIMSKLKELHHSLTYEFIDRELR